MMDRLEQVFGKYAKNRLEEARQPGLDGAVAVNGRSKFNRKRILPHSHTGVGFAAPIPDQSQVNGLLW